MCLKDKVAIVTGSGQGIGRGIAERFAQEGATVVVNDRDEATLGEAEQSLQALGSRVLAVLADVSLSDEVTQLFEKTQAVFGTVDILANNAAWSTPVAHFLDMTEEFWDTVLANNLKSMFMCSQQAAWLMVEQEKPGAIVNISSVAASQAHRKMVAYDASKGGLEAATRAMALDLAPWNIRINAVGPVSIITPAWSSVIGSEEKIAQACKMVPLERLGEPADIASAILYFASDEATFVTGQVLYVDGGMSAQLRPATFE